MAPKDLTVQWMLWIVLCDSYRSNNSCWYSLCVSIIRKLETHLSFALQEAQRIILITMLFVEHQKITSSCRKTSLKAVTWVRLRASGLFMAIDWGTNVPKLYCILHIWHSYISIGKLERIGLCGCNPNQFSSSGVRAMQLRNKGTRNPLLFGVFCDCPPPQPQDAAHAPMA